ncbi:MAG: adenosine-specific kinase [Ignisphaera sp.]|uniref:Adenosine monophosphate-protein transferase n=1 Tax=Ignisphaera aggregans TaxID=334771 RepID=A0A7J3I5Y9_9CREN
MSSALKFDVIDVPIPHGSNVIIGQSHFIKTVEDLYEALVTHVPGIKFGLAFNESSGKRLIRYEGNDEELVKYAIDVARRIGAGHVFVVYIRNAWPINIVNAIKSVQEVLRIYAATANPLQVIVVETNQGRGIVGVVDGYTPLGVEDEESRRERYEFLRRIGYKK